MTEMEGVEMYQRRIYNGLDLLKFLMATAVVAIHVKPFDALPILKSITQPILTAAVPIFFLITAFLFFRKCYSLKHDERLEALLRYCKRIGILYVVWFIIDFGYIYLRKNYFDNGMDGGVQLLKDVFFASTFPGSWFLSASVVALVIVWGMSRCLGSWLTFVVSFSLSLYLLFHDSLPMVMQAPYNWYAETFREQVWLSFPSALVWVSMGECFAKSHYYEAWEKFSRNNKKILAFLLLIVYVFAVMFGDYVRYLYVPLLFVLACCVDLKDSTSYRYLRNSSILIFFSHFWIAGKMGVFLKLVGSNAAFYHIVYYLMVVVICIGFAFLVLKLEQRKLWSFLKYLH